MEPRQIYPIRYVARRTGLTTHLIRAWERRHGAVRPKRTATNRRLYSEDDIERLQLLQRAIQAGHTIGQIADLTTDALLELLNHEEGNLAESLPFGHGDRFEASTRSHVEACLAAVENLDAHTLGLTLSRATVTLSKLYLIEQVIVPLIERLGDLWAEGYFRPSHEHMASAVIRSFLGDILRTSQVPPTAPGILVTTPVGQLHELGALVIAAVAVSVGWRTTYLGPNLPAEEIVGAAEQSQSRVVALSVVYPTGDPRLIEELTKLAQNLPDTVVIIAGGRAADAYGETLDRIGAIRLSDISSFRAKLVSLQP